MMYGKEPRMSDYSESNHTIKLAVDITSTFSLAAQQNSYPILKSVRITYPQSEDDLPSFNSLKLKLAGVEGWLAEETWHICVLGIYRSLIPASRSPQF